MHARMWSELATIRRQASFPVLGLAAVDLQDRCVQPSPAPNEGAVYSTTSVTNLRTMLSTMAYHA
jgi:hypothetical protein